MVENRLIPWRRGGMPTRGLFGPSLFGDLQGEINRLFEDFWGDGWGNGDGAQAIVRAPRVDLSETADAYRICAELPGLKEDEIEVHVAEGVLTLKGEHAEESERKDERYHMRERSHGSFQRAFRLPPTADAEAIAARFESGVLTVTVPKRPEAKAESRKIAIEKG